MTFLKLHYQVLLLGLIAGLLAYSIAGALDKPAPLGSFAGTPASQYGSDPGTQGSSYPSSKSYSAKPKYKSKSSSAPKCSYGGDFTNDAPGCQ